MSTAGRTAHGDVRRLALGWLIVLLLGGCATGEAPVDSAPNVEPLTWSPPPCGDADHRCVDLELRNTGSHQTPALDNDKDYRIHLPANGPLVGGFTIVGGRNVLVIGGRINLVYPCSNDASECIGLHIAKASPGAVFVEGVWVHNPVPPGTTCPGGASSTSQSCSTGDGIDVNTTNDGAVNVNTITLENIRVDGISGCSGQGDHSDVFQPYQAPAVRMRIDRMTGVTNCQGLTLDPDLGYSVWHQFPPSITVTHANVDVFANPYRGPSYQPKTWWLTYGTGCRSGTVVLTEAYSSEPHGNAVPDITWPDTTAPGCSARYAQGVLSWPGTQIEGVIRLGTPPGGDFVPEGAVGVGYRSPGYR